MPTRPNSAPACRRSVVGVILLLLSGLPAGASAAPVRNVVLMIADGASAGTWDMASYWQYGQLGRQPYDAFAVKLGHTTYPLNTSDAPTYDPTETSGYDPNLAWSATPNAGSYQGVPNYFDGYRYLKDTSLVTDSAASATAMASGVRTYLGAVNFDNNGQPLPFITQLAKSLGKSTGVVSSVPFTHATPAAFGAQNLFRDVFGEIGKQMVNDPTLDLIMGAGNPLYDSNGRLRATPYFAAETGAGGGYIAKSTWDLLNAPGAPLELIQTKEQFEAMANGTWLPSGRVIGVPQVYDTLQQSRTQAVQGADANNPSGVAFNPNVPTLATMARAALNDLGRDPEGLFLMIEGGAVDWAAHANQTARAIEEQMGFNDAVGAVVDWVETNSNWAETLLIVLTDHGTGLPLGTNSNTVAFAPVQNNGAGQLPGVLWHWGSHTNEDTLLFAQGAGAALFDDQVVGVDPYLASTLAFNDGRYVDNPAVYTVMSEAMTADMVPVPASPWLLLGGLVVLRFGYGRVRAC